MASHARPRPTAAGAGRARGRGQTARRGPKPKDVAEQEARRAANRAAPADPRRRRLAIAYDIDGPRIRLGIAWFLVEVAAAVVGVAGLAALFAGTAAVAALQTAQALRRAGGRPNRVVAGVAAGAVTLAGAVTTGLVGFAIIASAGASLFVGSSAAAANRRNDPYDVAGLTTRCWLLPGFAAASVVIAARFSFGGALALLLLAAAYETGDYLIGSGAANAYEGPVAGATAVLVTTFAITAVGVRPLTFPDSFVLGAMAAVLCPLGQLAASLVLPRYDAPAGALRRLDSLLLLAPAWALVVGILVK